MDVYTRPAVTLNKREFEAASYLHILIAEMDDRIDQIRQNCTPETGIEDIRTDREKYDKVLVSLRVTADEAMRGLGAGNFGG